MNWKLVLQLSMFGLFMAIGTVWFIPWGVEPFCWLAIFIICAIILARKLENRHFVHALMVGVFNSVWMTSFHIIFFDTYIAAHPDEAVQMQSMPFGGTTLTMLLFGPVIGVVSGAVLGLFTLVARRLTKRA